MFNHLYQTCPQYMNACDEYHIDLRGQKVMKLDPSMLALNDQFSCIDLTSNEIHVLSRLPQMNRLSTLMLSNNKIKSIAADFATSCPSLRNLILSNNKLSTVDQIDSLAQAFKAQGEAHPAAPGLERLCLSGNIVAGLPHYRAYTIYKMPPTLKVLDFQQVS